MLGSSSTIRISLGIKFILAVFAYKPEEIFPKFILAYAKFILAYAERFQVLGSRLKG
jgi:hypothetical protein